MIFALISFVFAKCYLLSNATIPSKWTVPISNNFVQLAWTEYNSYNWSIPTDTMYFQVGIWVKQNRNITDPRIVFRGNSSSPMFLCQTIADWDLYVTKRIVGPSYIFPNQNDFSPLLTFEIIYKRNGRVWMKTNDDRNKETVYSHQHLTGSKIYCNSEQPPFAMLSIPKSGNMSMAYAFRKKLDAKQSRIFAGIWMKNIFQKNDSQVGLLGHFRKNKLLADLDMLVSDGTKILSFHKSMTNVGKEKEWDLWVLGENPQNIGVEAGDAYEVWLNIVSRPIDIVWEARVEASIGSTPVLLPFQTTFAIFI